MERGEEKKKEKKRGDERGQLALIRHVGRKSGCWPSHVSQGKPFEERFVIKKNVVCIVVWKRDRQKRNTAILM